MKIHRYFIGLSCGIYFTSIFSNSVFALPSGTPEGEGPSSYAPRQILPESLPAPPARLEREDYNTTPGGRSPETERGQSDPVTFPASSSTLPPSAAQSRVRTVPIQGKVKASVVTASELAALRIHGRAPHQWKVLFVDDISTIRRIAEKRFQVDFKFKMFDMAVNGEEAIAKVKAAIAQESPYDLILMDLNMPVLEGDSATRGIRDYEKQVRQAQAERWAEGLSSFPSQVMIIGNSANDDSDVREKFSNAGANSYCYKTAIDDGYIRRLYEVLRQISDKAPNP